MVYIDKKFLTDNYVKNDLSLSDIEKKFGLKRSTVYRRLIEYNISRRGFGGHKNQINGTKKALTGKPSWNSGKKKKSYFRKGYKYILTPDNPMSRKDGYLAEHRLVLSNHLGRLLRKKELVHHKNGIKDDNRIENLVILLPKTHAGKVHCPYCEKEFFIR